MSSFGGKRESRNVSRILFSNQNYFDLRVVIYLGCLLPNTSCGSPTVRQFLSFRARFPRGVAFPVPDGEPDLNRDGKKTNHNPFDLAPYQGLPSQYLSILLVRSYRTFAPLTSRYCWCALTAPLHPYQLDTAGALLPHLCTLTKTVSAVRELPLHFKLAVFFCGTILAIARTGNYPVSLVFWESGLSSNLPQGTNLQPPHQLSHLSSLLLIDIQPQIKLLIYVDLSHSYTIYKAERTHRLSRHFLCTTRA